jgi:membrane-associated phospholipid phosphatase
MKSAATVSRDGHLKRWALPIFMTKSNKLKVGLLLWVLAAALYIPANHYHFFIPKLLPFTQVDRIIPFWPHSVWIYISEYIYFVTVFLTCSNLLNLNKYFFSFTAQQLFSVFIFWVWPTTFPRELFPLPENLDRLTQFAFSTLRSADTPANCCPSLHVSSVLLTSFIVFDDDQRDKAPLFLIWGIAISLSTLTTKQHYVVDVITGFLLALVTYWVFHKVISYQHSQCDPPQGVQAKR